MKRLAVLLIFFATALANAVGHAATPSIGAGTIHSVALKNDGTVRTWGDDSAGELGAGRPVSSPLAIPIPSAAGAVEIAVGFGHILMRKSDGTVWAWGDNSYGQLGDGTTISRPAPTQVAGLTGVASMVGSQYHSVALKSDGTVWTWGRNQAGQLGNGTTTDRPTPAAVSGLTGVVAIAAGQFHTVALKSDGSVWTWGSNFYGQLGDGTNSDRLTPSRSKMTGATAVSGGAGFTLALKGDGTVWGWGSNDGGYLGDGTGTDRNSPVRSGALTGVTAIAAGYQHAVALKGDGTVWSWGYGGDGELGDGTFGTRFTPGPVTGLSNVTAISAGTGYHTAALKSDGTVWTWGFNNFGELGDGTTNDAPVPVQMSGLASVVRIAVGIYQTVAIKSDGTVWIAGSNDSGQFADGGAFGRPVPGVLAGLADVTAVSAGNRHVLALKSDGTVWGWGDNFSGQLGDGTTSNRSSPVRVSGLSGVIAVAAGSSHSYALKSDGTLWGWGLNFDGQLGDGTLTTPLVPVQIAGVTDVIAISTGDSSVKFVPYPTPTYHSIALKRDGTVWTWGDNRFGQLGDGSTTDRIVPAQVSGVSNVIAVSAGADHTVVLERDGTMLAWGRNASGQLGNGFKFPYVFLPIPIPGVSGIAAISAGMRHTLALKADGTVLAWGFNGDGELGDGSTADHAQPATVSALTGITAVSAGATHSLAAKSDGTVWAWGGSVHGELGDGTLASRAKPVVVLSELGAGTIAANNWYLDLNPGASKTIPGDRIPAFLALASGSAASEIVDVLADVRFRAQDIGKSIHVFAYAPSAIVKSTKDVPVCVLSQLTPSGLQQASASNLQIIGNVASSQAQAVTVLNNVPATQVAGATFCVGAGTTGAQSLDASNNQCVVTVPPGQSGAVCLPPSAASSVAANTPGALSGLWWNPNESGWGIDFTQRGNIVFAAWYTYDGSGNPKWYVAPRCALPAAATSGSCTESLYEVNGPTFFGGAFDPSAKQVSAVGSLQLSFTNANAGSMTYTVAGQTRTVAIARQPFPSGTTAPPVDFTDLWWNPNESGWGVAITHQFNVMFLAWYVYDGAGKPVWYVASNCDVNSSQNGCTGTLYRTTGPAFGPTFDRSQVQVFTAGTVSLNFSDANNATLSYTVNGVSASKVITRQLF